MRRETLEAFLHDYAAAVREHGIIIDGCGCCDSPFVVELGEYDEVRKGRVSLEDKLAELLEHMRRGAAGA